jgi:hypothetical protein
LQLKRTPKNGLKKAADAPSSWKNIRRVVHPAPHFAAAADSLWAAPAAAAAAAVVVAVGSSGGWCSMLRR